MSKVWDELTINNYNSLIYKIVGIKENFYKNIKNIYNDTTIIESKKDSIAEEIIDICIDMNTEIIKFKYNLLEQNNNLSKSIQINPNKCILNGYNISKLRKYIIKMRIILKRFNSETFYLDKYLNKGPKDLKRDKSSSSASLYKLNSKQQLIKDLSTNLRNFIDSENLKIVETLSDVSCNDIDRHLEKHKNKIKIGEKYMLTILKYKYLLKDISSYEDLNKFKSTIDHYICYYK